MKKEWSDEQLDQALTDLYSAPVPQDYAARWREAVQREEKMNVKKQSRFWRAALPAAAALVLVVGALSVGGLKDRAAQKSYPAEANEAVPEMAYNTSMRSMVSEDAYIVGESADSAAGAVNTMDAGMTEDTVTGADEGRKLIRTASLRIGTKEYDAANEAVRALVTDNGGYIESMDERESGSRRVLEYTLRIPSERLDAFLAGAKGVGRVIAHAESTRDVSTQYADTALRLQTQKDKMLRLQELLKQAANVDEMLQIESEIANTQYQIDSYESSLRTIDRKAEDSEVTLSLYEESSTQVAQVKELTLGERLSNGLNSSVERLGEFMQDLLVFLAMALPTLAVLAVAGVVIWLIVRSRRKTRAAKQQMKPEDQEGRDQ